MLESDIMTGKVYKDRICVRFCCDIEDSDGNNICACRFDRHTNNPKLWTMTVVKKNGDQPLSLYTWEIEELKSNMPLISVCAMGLHRLKNQLLGEAQMNSLIGFELGEALRDYVL
jgi:hypothetical protein|nr:MAG TPA: hypothetical protein [Caudoviricetes sp.]